MNNDPNQQQSSYYGQQQPLLSQQPPLQSEQPQEPPLYESPPQWGQQPPPQYRQPPYGQLPYGVPPGPYYWPPQQPKKPSRRGLWIALAIIGGLVALVCIASSIFVALSIGSIAGSFSRIAGPEFTVQGYYQALEHQDYTKAYSYLSSNATVTVNGQAVPVTQSDAFATEAMTLDSTLGPVSYFRPNISGGDYSRIDVTVTRNGPSYLVHIQLIQVGSSWKIVNADGI
jgi:hypothetical protein